MNTITITKVIRACKQKLHILLEKQICKLRGRRYLPEPISVPRHTEGDDRPTILFINTAYPAFLTSLYSEQPELAGKNYQDQLKFINATCFGDADFYSKGMERAGWKAWDVVANCEALQKTWCYEHGLDPTRTEPLLEQIQTLRPDVVYFQDLALLTRDIHEKIRPRTKLIVGQIASPEPEQAHLSGFDVIISSFPHFVDRFRARGICSIYQPLAFEPAVLTKLGAKNIEHVFTFVGGISSAHRAGTQLLENVAFETPLELFGYGANALPHDSILAKRHHGEVWGLEMFRRLYSSGITLNRHIDVAGNYANNMRLFEATGCGALLITDYKDNLAEIFEIGTEVVAYRSPKECVELAYYYLNNPEKAATIALNGQRRTLRDHTYTNRMRTTAELLVRQLRYRDPAQQLPAPDRSRISTDYAPLDSATEVTTEMKNAWKSAAIPLRQRALVQQELAAMYRGRPGAPFKVLADVLRAHLRPDDTLLEIGCASGYYYEVLGYLLSKPFRYTGVDYSSHLIEMAKDYYPSESFEVADGAKLPYSAGTFRFVISGCVLLHVPEYFDHIRETVRVASEYIVAHRTPVCRRRATHWSRKLAYEVETVELAFNEEEFIDIFRQMGAKLCGQVEIHNNPAADEYHVTYLFKKQ